MHADAFVGAAAEGDLHEAMLAVLGDLFGESGWVEGVGAFPPIGEAVDVVARDIELTLSVRGFENARSVGCDKDQTMDDCAASRAGNIQDQIQHTGRAGGQPRL